jgi:hypothetical protein
MMSWEVPAVGVGDTVLFYAHEGAEPCMAFVTKVGKDTLELWALSPGYGGVDKSSVRHKDDPRLQDSTQWKQFGTWCHKPRDPRLAQLSERLSALENAVKGNKK